MVDILSSLKIPKGDDFFDFFAKERDLEFEPHRKKRRQNIHSSSNGALPFAMPEEFKNALSHLPCLCEEASNFFVKDQCGDIGFSENMFPEFMRSTYNPSKSNDQNHLLANNQIHNPETDYEEVFMDPVTLEFIQRKKPETDFKLSVKPLSTQEKLEYTRNPFEDFMLYETIKRKMDGLKSKDPESQFPGSKNKEADNEVSTTFYFNVNAFGCNICSSVEVGNTIAAKEFYTMIKNFVLACASNTGIEISQPLLHKVEDGMKHFHPIFQTGSSVREAFNNGSMIAIDIKFPVPPMIINPRASVSLQNNVNFINFKGSEDYFSQDKPVCKNGLYTYLLFNRLLKNRRKHLFSVKLMDVKLEKKRVGDIFTDITQISGIHDSIILREMFQLQEEMNHQLHVMESEKLDDCDDNIDRFLEKAEQVRDVYDDMYEEWGIRNPRESEIKCELVCSDTWKVQPDDAYSIKCWSLPGSEILFEVDIKRWINGNYFLRPKVAGFSCRSNIFICGNRKKK